MTRTPPPADPHGAETPVTGFPVTGFPVKGSSNPDVPATSIPEARGAEAPVAPAADAAAISTASLVQLQGLLARQANTTAALQQLVHWVSERLPHATVRIAWGENQPRGLFDRRLGKLGPESSLWSAVQARWNECSTDQLAAGADTTSANTTSADTTSANTTNANTTSADTAHWIVLPAGDASSRMALLWIDSPGGLAFPQLQALAGAAEALGAVLWSRPRIQLADSHLLTPGCWSWRWIVAGLVLLGLAFLPVPYRVSCHATVQPQEQRMVAAPFAATLLECLVEPGDKVTEGQRLLVLDGRPLQLELEALRADLSQAMKRQSSAMATGKVAESQLAQLEREQLEKQIELFEDRLAQLAIQSPIDGIVISGDLQRSIGTPLEIGEPLLEIAPLQPMRVELEIPEEEIAFVSRDAPVRVRLNAAVHRPLDGQLQRLFPRAEVRREQNVFIGRWEIEKETAWLRPGMEGDAVVYGPRRAWVWPWVRRGREAVLRAIGW